MQTTAPKAKNQLSAEAESTPNQLLFAKAQMKCLRQGPKTRTSQHLRNYECTITDGLLAAETQYKPVEMTLNGHTAAIIQDAFGLMVRKGQQTDGIRLGGNLHLQFAFPLPPADVQIENGPIPLSMAYWTPGAIAA